MSFRAVHGNRVELLLGALMEALPPADPFAPTTIVVGSHLVSRWLTRELAIARGIAAGLDMVTFDRFVERVWAGDDAAREANLVALDKAQLAAAIASVLADGDIVRTLPAVESYLAAAPDPGDRAGPRRVQLAEHVAQLAWNYALTRPDWMPALLGGRVPDEMASDIAPPDVVATRATAKWQAALLGAAMDKAGCGTPTNPRSGSRSGPRSGSDSGPRSGSGSGPRGLCSPVPTLPWARRRAGLATPRLDKPVFVFGVSFLLRSQLEALTDLASTTDVIVFLLDPCAQLWDDVSGRAKAESRVDPLPLALWGRATRDTLGALVERTGGDLADSFEEPAEISTAREALLADVLQRQLPAAAHSIDTPKGPAAAHAIDTTPNGPRAAHAIDTPKGPPAAHSIDTPNGPPAAHAIDTPNGPPAAHAPSGPVSAAAIDRPAGVRVLACPDPRREIEIVAAEIRAILDADPSLHAREIGVWIASNAERYLAQAPAAFEAVGVPSHLIDAPIDDRGRIGEAVLALLELPTGAMARRDLLRVMTHPAVLAGHSHVDPDDWVVWTEKLGIVHGANHDAHKDTYLADHPGRFHWDQGVRRLALGAFMIGGPDVIERGPVKIAGIDVAPEEIRPEKHASAATYALLVRSLCADAAWLLEHEATLTEWATVFVALVDSYLARPTEEASRDVERVRSMLAGLAHIDLDGRKVGFREAREHAARRLVTARANRGEPLAAGVMIAPLQAMRALPFRVAFIVGLDEGAFPAGDQPSPLDIRHESRAGDISPRDRDRHAFFEVLLGTRDALSLSYVAVEAKSGQALGPSSVVLELADALAPYLGAGSSKAALEKLTTRYPLHRFSATDAKLPPAVIRERWAVRTRDALRAHLRASGHPVPDEDGMLALLADPHLTELRGALGIVEAPATLPPPPPIRPLSLANVRKFLEAPVQAWAQSVLGLDEVADDTELEHSDEPFHVDKPARAVLLREVLAAQLRDPSASAEERYLAVVRDLELRGQFPVGVFGEAARAVDLRLLDEWRRLLGPVEVGSARRLAFGRSSSPAAELLPALELSLPGGRTVRLVGQTELLLRRGDKHMSVIPLVGKADKRSRHHLRGALDHVVLAAAGFATTGHEHVLLDADANMRQVEHAPWTQADARDYLTTLVTTLLDEPHGYLLPFDHLVNALAGKPPARIHGDAITTLLGFGPITRIDGLVAPPRAGEIATRRLAPLVTRMKGDHSLGGAES
jgi:exodeoxyribonuclease V gamma subunit